MSFFLVLIIKVTLNFTYKIIQTSCTNEFGLKSKENVKILLFQNLVCARVDVWLFYILSSKSELRGFWWLWLYNMDMT